MTELRRILDDGEDELARSLLRAAKEEDVAGPGARARTVAALGLGGTLAAVLGTKSVWLSAWKYVGVAMLAGGAVALHGSGSASNVDGTASPLTREAPVAVVAPGAASPAVQNTASWTPVAAPAGPVVPEKSAPSAHRAAKGPPAIAADPRPAANPANHAGAPAARGSGLGAEIAALDAVRGALAAGDPVRALAGVDAYQRDFPRGVLAQEGTLLRIEVLLASGDTARAHEAGDAFVAAHRRTPYARRVQTMLGD